MSITKTQAYGPIRYCVDCTHHKQHGHRHTCVALTICLVTGQQKPYEQDCADMRGKAGACGASARLFAE